MPVLVLLAACEPDPRTAAPAEDQAEEQEDALPPPPKDPRRFIGRWARSDDQCTTDWWRFWADELRTATEGLRCDILPPDASFSDTELRTLCRTREGGVRETWNIEYGEDAETMTITGEEGQTVNLVKCA
ncbi:MULTISPECIES: hypothetical protein [Pacificimonas]|uniref:Lipoprotein n=1 Tax=Pacificimonas aurantium TaxID=1250540 RepID=A0ABS7WM56_9SPHN|nr:MULTISPECIES: hypothetical protein [Pacificimonas]MBZ6379483.1 hypothetical protein [Pacificimonas aurantium]